MRDVPIKSLKSMPELNKIKIKNGFEKRYRYLLGKDFDIFMKYSLSFLNKCIRVNTLKIPVQELKKRLEKGWKLTQVPWCNEGFWIEGSRLDIGNLIEHQLGYIYVQESASMIPPVVLDLYPGQTVLDMCAAPGSKSSQIAQYMRNKGLLICNDIQGSRLKALGINIQKTGVSNAIITMMDGHRFKDYTFDRILVDAPCSGTGTIRKSLKTLNMWSEGLVRKMSRIQYQLLKAGFANLKRDGVLVYSTCTLEPEENEAVVSRLLDEFENAKLEDINIIINRAEPILEFQGLMINSEVKKCLRIYPHNNNSEGFFVAKIRKI